MSLLSYLLLVDFPEEAHKSWKFLSKDEPDFVIRRVNHDRIDAITNPFIAGVFFWPALDLKVWVFAFMFFCVTLVGYSINYYLPIILLGMGTNCLRPALFICSLIRKRSSKLQRLCFLAQDSTDSTHRLLYRPGSMSHCSTLGIYGAHDVRSSMVQRQIPSPRPRHCHERGTSSHRPSFNRILHQQSISILWSLLRHSRLERQHPPGSNLPGKQHPRTLETRVLQRNLVGFGGIGGIAGALVFRSQDQPRYLPSVYAATANVCILFCTAELTTWFYYCNRRARQGLVVLEGLEKFFLYLLGIKSVHILLQYFYIFI